MSVSLGPTLAEILAEEDDGGFLPPAQEGEQPPLLARILQESSDDEDPDGDLQRILRAHAAAKQYTAAVGSSKSQSPSHSLSAAMMILEEDEDDDDPAASLEGPGAPPLRRLESFLSEDDAGSTGSQDLELENILNESDSDEDSPKEPRSRLVPGTSDGAIDDDADGGENDNADHLGSEETKRVEDELPEVPVDPVVYSWPAPSDSQGVPLPVLSLPEIDATPNGVERVQALHRWKASISPTVVSPLETARRQQLEREARSINHAAKTSPVLKLDRLSLLESVLPRYRKDVGEPTCWQTHDKWITVGTSQAVVMVFDHFQSLVVPLGQIAQTEARGPVTCVATANQDQWAIVGHRNGHIVVWEIISKTVLHVVEPSPDPEGGAAAITSLIPLPNSGSKIQFLAVNSRGVVNRHTLSKVFFSYTLDTQCLLRDRTGHVPSAALLRPTPEMPHPGNASGLAAFACETFTLVTTLEASNRVIGTIPRNERARVGALPVVAWRPLSLRDRAALRAGALAARELAIAGHPVLAVGRGSTLELYSVQPDLAVGGGGEGGSESAGAAAVPMKMYRIGDSDMKNAAEITGLSWISDQFLLVLTNRQDARLVEPLAMVELESVDIGHLGLLRHQFFRNPITSTTEISYQPAFAAAPAEGGVLLGGSVCVAELKLQSWAARVNSLIGRGLWEQALALSLGFFRGDTRAAASLPRALPELQGHLIDRLSQILLSYVDARLDPILETDAHKAFGEVVQLSSLPEPGSPGVEQDHLGDQGNQNLGELASIEARNREVFQRAAFASIEFAVHIGKIEQLFGSVLDKFAEAGATNVFLGCLLRYALVGRLPYLPEPVLWRLSSFAGAQPDPVVQRLLGLSPEAAAALQRLVVIPALSPRRLLLEQLLLRFAAPRLVGLPDAQLLCLQNRLWTGFAHFRTQSVQDWITPLKLAVAVILSGRFPEKLRGASPRHLAGPDGIRNPAHANLTAKEKRQLGFELMLYLQMSLVGRAYPGGQPLQAVSALQQAKRQVWTALFSDVLGGAAVAAAGAGPDQDPEDSLEAATRAVRSQDVCRCLLQLDAHSFLQLVVAPVLDSEGFFQRPPQSSHDPAGGSEGGADRRSDDYFFPGGDGLQGGAGSGPRQLHHAQRAIPAGSDPSLPSYAHMVGTGAAPFEADEDSFGGAGLGGTAGAGAGSGTSAGGLGGWSMLRRRKADSSPSPPGDEEASSASSGPSGAVPLASPPSSAALSPGAPSPASVPGPAAAAPGKSPSSFGFGRLFGKGKKAEESSPSSPSPAGSAASAVGSPVSTSSASPPSLGSPPPQPQPRPGASPQQPQVAKEKEKKPAFNLFGRGAFWRKDANNSREGRSRGGTPAGTPKAGNTPTLGPQAAPGGDLPPLAGGDSLSPLGPAAAESPLGSWEGPAGASPGSKGSPGVRRMSMVAASPSPPPLQLATLPSAQDAFDRLAELAEYLQSQVAAADPGVQGDLPRLLGHPQLADLQGNNILDRWFAFAAYYLAKARAVTHSSALVFRLMDYLCLPAGVVKGSPQAGSVAAPTAAAESSVWQPKEEIMLALLKRGREQPEFVAQLLQDDKRFAGLLQRCERVRFWRVYGRLLHARGRHLEVLRCYLGAYQTEMRRYALEQQQQQQQAQAAPAGQEKKGLAADKASEALRQAEAVRVLLFDYIGKVVEQFGGGGGSGGGDAGDNHQVSAQALELREALMEMLPQLVDLDAEATARLVLRHFAQDTQRVLKALGRNEELQYRHLRAVMTASQTARSAAAIASAQEGSPLEPGVVLAAAEGITPAMHETYIGLLCKFAPREVYHHLTSHQSYDIDKALQMCRQHGINDATAYLLERTGDTQGALRLMLETLGDRINGLQRGVNADWEALWLPKAQRSGLFEAIPGLTAPRQQPKPGSNPATLLDDDEASPAEELSRRERLLRLCRPVLDMIQVTSALCRRAMESEQLRFSVLDEFVRLKRALRRAYEARRRLEEAKARGGDLAALQLLQASSPPPVDLAAALAAADANGDQPPADQALGVFQIMDACMHGFIRIVLELMIAEVPIPLVIRKITEDYQDEEYQEFRASIRGMIENCQFELTLLETAKRLLQSDMFRSLRKLMSNKTRAISQRSTICAVCVQDPLDPLASTGGSLVLFDCGHCFHEECLQEKGGRRIRRCPNCEGRDLAEAKEDEAGGAAGSPRAAGAAAGASSDKVAELSSKEEQLRRRLQARATEVDWEALQDNGAEDNDAQQLLQLRPEPEPDLQPAWQPPLWSIPTPPGFLQQLQQFEESGSGSGGGALPAMLAPAKIQWPAHMQHEE